ncbi:hypothetical protein [Streptomyces fuscigenes]|uniref:hypothetical protein n=1 Tax=Streptomyces fuscigenes TaxID=1528880 RepID=UPI001F1D444A|nr:hypothetical protein [Streptomyces fuscigenes]MCF3962966.1 hypothetical protein [Streptomyces fuscigenes]
MSDSPHDQDPPAPRPAKPPAEPDEERPYRPARRGEPLQRLLFGGVYGSVLASALAAALNNEPGAPDPGYDALWVFAAAVAASAAHGYAHAIAHRTIRNGKVTPGIPRSVVREWPLLASAAPTVALLLGAYIGWWSESGALDVSLAVNIVALFGWGLWAARVAGQRWPAACRAGGGDMLLGLFIVVVNVLTK